MDMFYALEQTTHRRITELHQQKAQLNLGALASNQGKRSVSMTHQVLPFAVIQTALSVKSRLAIGVMLAVALWFGCQAWMNQAAIHASNALTFNSERFFIAAVIMGCLCWRARARFTKRAVLGGCATGFTFALMITCESQSLMLGSAQRTAFLGSLFVILMPFLGRLFRGQKLYSVAVAGSVIVIVGTWCLFGAPNGSRGGDFFGLLRAAACAGMLIAIQHFAGEDWRVASFINLSVVAVFSIVVAGMTGQMQVSLQPTVLFPAAISAVLRIRSWGNYADLDWTPFVFSIGRRTHVSGSAVYPALGRHPDGSSAHTRVDGRLHADRYRYNLRTGSRIASIASAQAAFHPPSGQFNQRKCACHPCNLGIASRLWRTGQHYQPETG